MDHHHVSIHRRGRRNKQTDWQVPSQHSIRHSHSLLGQSKNCIKLQQRVNLELIFVLWLHCKQLEDRASRALFILHFPLRRVLPCSVIMINNANVNNLFIHFSCIICIVLQNILLQLTSYERFRIFSTVTASSLLTELYIWYSAGYTFSYNLSFTFTGLQCLIFF